MKSISEWLKFEQISQKWKSDRQVLPKAAGKNKPYIGQDVSQKKLELKRAPAFPAGS